MMFAVSNVEQAKFDAFLRGLGDFDNAAAQPGIWPANAQVGNVAINPNVLPVPSAGKGITDTEDKISEIEEKITEAAGGLGLGDNVRIVPDERGVRAIITTDAVLFASGSASMTPTGSRLLEGVADVLATMPYRITVEGHSDNVPLQRGDYDNWNLSTDRAVAVLHQFVKHDIKPERLVASGYGEHRPLDPANTSEARAKNRRVEIIVHVRSELTPTSVAVADATAQPTVDGIRDPLPTIDVTDPTTLTTTP
jgi:chemotaxis protein MotB